VSISLIFEGACGAIPPEGLRRPSAADGGLFAICLMPVHAPHPYRQDDQAGFN
jgi:hypothetical protein